MTESETPSVIRSLAVTTDDLVAAIEARDRDRHDVVLRITPPFSGRMRARLHVEGVEGEYDGTDPVHISPRAFLADGVPRYPGRGPEHWRSAVCDALQKRVELDTSVGPQSVRVTYLG